ncbi:MAG: S9 family peptidase [Bacteroidales bacterium]|nr:S9 family peptidase [Bacteroidales bacterium]
MYKITIILAMALLSVCSHAQSRLFTIEDATGLNRSLSPKRLSQLQWCGGSMNFSLVEGNYLISESVKSAARDTLLDLNKLNGQLTEMKTDSLKRFPAVTFSSPSDLWFVQKGQIFNYSLEKKRMRTLNSYNPKGENVEIDPEQFHVAFTLDHNIFVSVDGEEKQVTVDGKVGLEYGTSVHRNEFGISKGLFWSPKGDLLAFYRMDESMVSDYPLVDIDTRMAEVAPTKYPMAGMTSHEVTIGVYNPASGSTIYLNTEKPADQYLTNITWSPDQKFIYVAVLNRDQNHLWLNQYDATDGTFVKTLFEESSDSYVEPQHELYFLPDHPNSFVWMSDRNGYNHLYLYDTNGELIRQLTKGEWVVTNFTGFDPKGTTAFFMCTKNNPLGDFMYSVDLHSLELTEITKSPGSHRVLLSDDANYILDTYSSLTVPSVTELLDARGRQIRMVQESPDPLEGYELGKTEIFSIPNEDNIDLYCRLIKPVGFDATKQYPVFIYVYGGPHSQLVTDSWLGGGGFFLNYMAQQGFVVFTLDNRGTANRGTAFEHAIFRQVGTAEMADQMSGVNYLKSLPWVDTTRIGINGWSYGGFMALTMALRNPGQFPVVVAGGPVVDWKYYEVMYGERYMDTPEANPDGYKTSCLLNYVKDLTGDILIIQGYQDNTVVPQNALNFIKRCVEEGKQVDFFLYPNHPHNVRGKDRVHLNTMILDYFNEGLAISDQGLGIRD